MHLIKRIALVLITLVIALTLLGASVNMADTTTPAGTQTHSQSQLDTRHDNLVKFIGTQQQHLLRLEQALRGDNHANDARYELVQSWFNLTILQLLLGMLLLIPLLYHKHYFRDCFATIHRRRLQRQHLQYRFSQRTLTA
ncbi:hypothetical protein [Aeromonas cavernicola]|uniref:Uncharacterized protein n=1 Tax=Aeromonas cavernicola TaxID=1006623 RepID=A0A2H9U7V7_9GAMM|nr:hypothetical protein [Aeromonas cavernicola]PJG60059.1 hypothetical protein CUC53_03935 [Aeromonas cavernicola]